MSEVQKSSSFSQGKINGLAKLGPTKSCCLWAGPAAQWAYSWASLFSCKFSLPCCDMQFVPETDTEIADTEIAAPNFLPALGVGASIMSCVGTTAVVSATLQHPACLLPILQLPSQCRNHGVTSQSRKASQWRPALRPSSTAACLYHG